MGGDIILFLPFVVVVVVVVVVVFFPKGRVCEGRG